jgi:hypothetical protein
LNSRSKRYGDTIINEIQKLKTDAIIATKGMDTAVAWICLAAEKSCPSTDL